MSTPGMDRREYAALKPERAARLRRSWRDAPGATANTLHGAPFPLRSWPPDAAIDIQLLAEWVDPEGGDTGWRDVSTSLINGWTGTILTRRTGRHVWVTLNVSKSTANGPFQITGAGPAGFKPNVAGTYIPAYDPTEGVMTGFGLGTLSASTWLYLAPGSVAYAGGKVQQGMLNYLTDEAWPTTLPGTPA